MRNLSATDLSPIALATGEDGRPPKVASSRFRTYPARRNACAPCTTFDNRSNERYEIASAIVSSSI